MQIHSIFIATLSALVSAIPAPGQLTKRALSDLPGSGALCNGFAHNSFSIEDAANAAIARGIQPGVTYPEVYGNSDQIGFPARCAGADLLIFPVLESGIVWTQGPGNTPGPHRVVYQPTGNGNGRYCGMITHPPGDTRRFMACQDVA